MNLKNIKLKTLLVFPPFINKIDKKIRLASAPLGIAILSGYLKKIGYKHLELIDLQNNGKAGTRDNIELVQKNILLKKQNIVGFSVSYNYQMPEAIKIAREIKKINKEIFLFAGGSGLATNINRLLKNDLVSLNLFDAFILGDGEEPLARLINNLNYKKSLKDIPNLMLRDNKTGEFKKNKRFFKASKRHLHTKPNFKDLDVSSIIPIRASLGCYWGKCTFCYNSGSKNRYELANVEKLVSLIKEIKKENRQKKFFFYDDSLPPFYLKKLAKQLIKEKVNINWGARGGCVDDSFEEKRLPELLKKSGCYSLSFGAESFSPRILKLMRKMQSVEKIFKITRPLKEIGIKIVLYTMFGFPTEKIEDINMTLAAFKENPDAYDLAYVNYFNLDGDSYISKHPGKFKIKITDPTDPKFPKIETSAVSAKKILEMIKKYKLEEKAIIDKSMYRPA
jgi:radical SAM superfamily enzyme YgiQ (UPF0313 family)